MYRGRRSKHSADQLEIPPHSYGKAPVHGCGRDELYGVEAFGTGAGPKLAQSLARSSPRHE
jgi:hypothetical protein